MDTASENHSICQINDISVNMSVNLADQNGGGDADKSPGRDKEAIGACFEHLGQGEQSKDGDGVEGSSPGSGGSLFLGPIRRSPDFAMELMASGPPRHMVNTPQGPVEPQTNLIVNYLPQTLSDDDFRLMFTNIGPIYSCRIMRDKRTGYSFGYGFVNYVKTQDAAKAINTLNGKQIQNKQIKVALARPSGEDIKHANLYVKGITKEMKREELTELFKPYGDIIQSKILVDQYTGFSKGAGFILFSKRSEADAAIQALHNTKPAGLNDFISVKRAKDETGEKSMVHHVIHHYQYPQGGSSSFSGPDLSGYPMGAYPMGYPSSVSAPMAPPPLSQVNPMNPMNASRNANFYPSPYGPSGANRGQMPTVKLEPQPPYNFVPSSYPAQLSAVSNGPVVSDAGFRNLPDVGFRTNFSNMSLSSSGSSKSGNNVNEHSSEVLFVYNIGANSDEKTLYTLFQPYGDITKVNVIRDHSKNGLSKGFGFVSMATSEQAQVAMEHLNGYVLNGRAIQVSPKK